MPLHLLGKKSWNVYNPAAIEKVRRDESNAAAREEAAEQRMQDEDAARRIAILRGETVPDLAPEAEDEVPRRCQEYDSKPRKRRKLRGEDDTDADIRFAREDALVGEKVRDVLGPKREKAISDAPLVDRTGHLQLVPVPDERTTRKMEKNAELEAEKAKKQKREEDLMIVKFSNAAGYGKGLAKPWYAANAAGQPEDDVGPALDGAQGKDVWGNPDPRRKEREQNRVVSNDPFAAMQQARRQLKQSTKDRELWELQRQKELQALKAADDERRRRRRKREHSRRDDVDDLEGFSLDATTDPE
ncbi:hypothetical protein B0A48_17886 [Cryoendolithus antarcticus]|uniref:CBF1-interacting co-repressor CIR N-terminal domain-containing protein n=1 Tax=Cryoendolithus antarcticus TaxID=1507870 RepID=A0A1V8SAC1_9PEZI|nr:hypothetical protein B0A48_17886 [Cryoendolithus antarcticus]